MMNPSHKLLVERWPTYRAMQDVVKEIDDQFSELAADAKTRLASALGSEWIVDLTTQDYGVDLYALPKEWKEHPLAGSANKWGLAGLSFAHFNSDLVNLVHSMGRDDEHSDYPRVWLYSHLDGRRQGPSKKRGFKKLMQAVLRLKPEELTLVDEDDRIEGWLGYLNLNKISESDVFNKEVLLSNITNHFVALAESLSEVRKAARKWRVEKRVVDL